MMLARSAEDLYWIGRYLERAEHMARSIDVVYHRLLESPESERRHVWSEALRMNGFPDDTLEHISADADRIDNEAVARYCMTSGADGSALDGVRRLRANARGNREHLPIELWEEINRFWLDFRPDGEEAHDAAAVCSMVRRRCQSIVGTADATWSRTDPFTYFTLGRLLERALLILALLRTRQHHHTLDRPLEWSMTLRCGTALQAHRRAFAGFHDPRSIDAVLVYDSAAPRSVHFCVGHLRRALDRLEAPQRARSRRVISRLEADLEFGDPFDMAIDDIAVAYGAIDTEIRRFGAALAAEFFLLPLETGLRSLRLGAIDSMGSNT